MVANFQPIYSRVWDVQVGHSILGPTANTNLIGVAAGGCNEIFIADATEGGYVQKVVLKAVGTTAATVARIFYCSNTTGAFVAGTTNTADNTSLLAELALAAWTASNTTASPQYEIPINQGFGPGTRLLITFGTSTGAANNGFAVTTVGGKY